MHGRGRRFEPDILHSAALLRREPKAESGEIVRVIRMNRQTTKFLKQLAIIFLAAAVLMILPRFLVASLMGLINLAVLIATIWIFYRIFGPIYRDWRRRNGPKPPQNRYSDRR